MAKVSRRGGFSDRNGIKKINSEIQLKDFDERTRIQLQNMINRMYNKIYYTFIYSNEDDIQNFLKYVIGEIYSEPVFEEDRYDERKVCNCINKTILDGEYDDVLTLIEAILQYWDSFLRRVMVVNYSINYSDDYKEETVYEIANGIFKKEYVGYRFVDGVIVPITDEYELDALNTAMMLEYTVVREHLGKANRYLADRNRPDYENSIKESISAVEAMCEILTGVTGKEASLSNLLKNMEQNGIIIHSGLKSAFLKLFGYTSDAKGIRHAGDIGGPSATFEEAKFMLVSCSAFVNYLRAVTAD